MPNPINQGQVISIEDVQYTVSEHPTAPGMPYGQEGRVATVLKLESGEGARALKVFKPRFVDPHQVALAGQLASFAALPGLSVCRRVVLTPQRHTPVLRTLPDLTYAVLMPWIEGPTWTQVITERQTLSLEQALSLARSLACLFAEMEQRGLAHCDLSGANLILPGLVNEIVYCSPIELVDVEQMYAAGLTRPTTLTSGSPGYAHCSADSGVWDDKADRFAGALLLAEILGWVSPAVRAAAWSESYFSPVELQRNGERYQLLLKEIRSIWGDGAARLLEFSWKSELPADCPTFGQWMMALPDDVPVEVPSHPDENDEHDPDKDRADTENTQTNEKDSDGTREETQPELNDEEVNTPDLLEPDWKQIEVPTGAEEEIPKGGVEAELGILFERAQAALNDRNLPLARRLLEEVLRQRPDYQRGGILARDLLRQTNATVKTDNVRKPRILPVLLILFIVACVLFVLVGGSITAISSLGNNQPATTYLDPTATPVVAKYIPAATATPVGESPNEGAVAGQVPASEPTAANTLANNSQNQSSCTTTVTSQLVYLLKGPDPNHKALDVLYAGDEILLLATSKNGNWYQVEAKDTTGWLYKDWIYVPICANRLSIAQNIPASPLPAESHSGGSKPQPPADNPYPYPLP